MSSHPYATLTPERVMDAVDSLGYLCDARILALNSYENRVYQVGIEDQLPLIAKFYRPGRWSRAAIAEEHQFLFELEREELPVVAPILHGGESIFEFDGFYFALFPRRGGHAPELSNEDDLELLGRWLGRLHNIGSRKPFAERATIRGGDDIRLAAEQVLKCGLMPDDFRPAYELLIRDLLAHIDQQYPADQLKTLRLHGDLHTGNLLLREDVLHMVDFDDCIQGPAMQDIWMLLSGDRAEQRQQLMVISEGYEMFRPFPNHELRLIESLRTVRIVRYAAWLSQRWDDPAFPIAFPWFEGHRFWSEHLLSLREQLAALQEEPLSISVY